MNVHGPLPCWKVLIFIFSLSLVRGYFAIGYFAIRHFVKDPGNEIYSLIELVL